MELFYALFTFAVWTFTAFEVLHLVELVVVERTAKSDYWSAARWNLNWHVVLVVVSFFTGLVGLLGYFVHIS